MRYATSEGWLIVDTVQIRQTPKRSWDAAGRQMQDTTLVGVRFRSVIITASPVRNGPSLFGNSLNPSPPPRKPLSSFDMTLSEIKSMASHLPEDGNALAVIPSSALMTEIERRRVELTKEIALLNRRRKSTDSSKLADDVTTAIRKASELFGVKQRDIHGMTRTVELTRPRFAVWHALRINGHSLESIADSFGGREHGSISNGVARCVEFMAQDDQYRSHVEEITLAIA